MENGHRIAQQLMHFSGSAFLYCKFKAAFNAIRWNPVSWTSRREMINSKCVRFDREDTYVMMKNTTAMLKISIRI